VEIPGNGLDDDCDGAIDETTADGDADADADAATEEDADPLPDGSHDAAADGAADGGALLDGGGCGCAASGPAGPRSAAAWLAFVCAACALLRRARGRRR
jgi:hypothetical protein